MKVLRRAVLAGGLAIGVSPARAAFADDTPVALSDEPSRSDLFGLVKSAAEAEDAGAAHSASEYFNLWGPFRFPNDCLFDVVEQKERANSMFGVDISHYTKPTFPIEQLARRQATFLYMKASQASRYFDDRFPAFYKRAIALDGDKRVHAGAYHFLSSADPGAAQAKNFLRVLTAAGAITGGKLRDTDMPPVVDMEWDIKVKNGPDRWKGKTPAQILQVAKDFLDAVEQGTGRKPMIYTARAWWRERIGTNELGPLAGHPLWLADYSKTSRGSENPPGLGGAAWTLWQFTDSATMSIGFAGAFDANIYKGPTDNFYSALGVAKFT